MRTEEFDRGKKIIFKNEYYLVRNFFESDTTALKEFFFRNVTIGVDSIETHFYFYRETKEVNIESVKKNRKLLYDNERELLVIKYAFSKNFLRIHYQNKYGNGISTYQIIK